MDFVRKRTPLEKEWERVIRQEERFCKKWEKRKDSFLNRQLKEKVPEKLQDTLTTAFSKAFGLVFDKGTAVIERTYDRNRREQDFQINQYAAQVRADRKSLRTFGKQADRAGARNVAVSAVSGTGLGILGIGIPDIPLFIGMVFKALYECALSFGYPYDAEEERYFLLLMIQGGVACGEEQREADRRAEAYLTERRLPEGYDRKGEVDRTAALLSRELLYLKFLQGIPIVGAAGGICDAVYLRRILEYANLKYRKRFLMDQRK